MRANDQEAMLLPSYCQEQLKRERYARKWDVLEQCNVHSAVGAAAGVTWVADAEAHLQRLLAAVARHVNWPELCFGLASVNCLRDFDVLRGQYAT